MGSLAPHACDLPHLPRQFSPQKHIQVFPKNVWENQRKHTIKMLYLKNWTVKVLKNLTTCC
jgi:hypothetical protein